jgi:hypothetical protein
LGLRKGQRRALIAIDRRPLDLADRIARGMIVANEMLIEVR